MFANPESIILDSYSSNYTQGISLSIYQSNYIILIMMSYLNCINNIFYNLIKWKNYSDQYNIPNYILLSGRSHAPSGSGIPSGFGQGSSNSNTGGSNGGGGDNNNKKRKHEEGEEEILTSKDKGKGKAVNDGDVYDNHIQSNKDY